MKCEIPPEDWTCSRPAGHDGPCAASPVPVSPEPERNPPEAIRDQVGPCREWVDDKHNICGEPSEFVLWGKLFPAEGLGPRCYDHAAKHAGHRALGDPSYAIIDVRRLSAAFDAVVAERDAIRAANGTPTRYYLEVLAQLEDARAERDAVVAAGQKLAEAAGNYAIYATTVKGEYGPLSDAVDEALAAWRAVSGSSEPR